MLKIFYLVYVSVFTVLGFYVTTNLNFSRFGMLPSMLRLLERKFGCQQSLKNLLTRDSLIIGTLLILINILLYGNYLTVLCTKSAIFWKFQFSSSFAIFKGWKGGGGLKQVN